jgi:hypothetical protein
MPKRFLEHFLLILPCNTISRVHISRNEEEETQGKAARYWHIITKFHLTPAVKVAYSFVNTSLKKVYPSKIFAFLVDLHLLFTCIQLYADVSYETVRNNNSLDNSLYYYYCICHGYRKYTYGELRSFKMN